MLTQMKVTWSQAMAAYPPSFFEAWMQDNCLTFTGGLQYTEKLADLFS